MDHISILKLRLKEACPQLDLREQEPLSRHTSFRVGGPVSLMALAKTKEEAVTAVKVAADTGVNPFFLGKGSNLLVSDDGFSSFIIKCVSGMDGICKKTEQMIDADSGVSLSQVAVFAMEQSLSGLEFAHGIPGSLGGAVFMNAGAYDGEMSQIVIEVDCITKEGEQERISAANLDFGYRHSVFSDENRLILGARLQLKPGNPDEIQAKMLELMERRRAKQPLEFPSAGSTFKRPPGHFAGTLIEKCGLKGMRIGGAQVSEKHAGFVVNTGGATCDDILRLMRKVRESVFQETGVLLESEIRMLGCQL